ncbi:NAD(P)-dependent oxidoreductase [Patescibacteria group bacterium]|nr:NAD(P)-dependent oxidoreductase [Patescibacteria group bacterium]MBU4057446.1 NAD(P)-dependent oxidoreductase [Patescibacteria group bacterium]MBU4115781.1 NAD(P)-dependent oxidoreductase [Patescibacteria group bacterium]
MKRQITNLVLGSEGFIGKPFCLFLEELGEKVVRFDIKNGEHEDIRNVKIPFKGIDRIYFFAWDVGGAKYLFKEDTLLGQLDWNMKLLQNTMPQLKKSGVPFLFLSSQYAEEYGTPYGALKRLGEIWTKILPNGYYARQWNAYGTIESENIKSHVICDFIHQAITTGEIKMLSTGEEYRQFTHLEDSFRAYHKVLSEGIRGDVYNINSGEWTKIIDLANMIAEVTGAKVKRGKNKSVDHRKIFSSYRRVPGWKPRIKLKSGLSKLIKEYSNQRNKTTLKKSIK